MDNLKKYVDDNRQAFDLQEPTDALWQKIEGRLPVKPAGKSIDFKPKRWLNWRVAASITILLGLGYSVGRYWAPAQEYEAILGLSPKHGSEVIQYASFIEEKKKTLQSFSDTDPALLEDFSKDLEDLNVNYEKLKESLPNNPNQEEILNRMIDNLQWQMQLLDDQLDIIKERNQEEKDEFVIREEFNVTNSQKIWA